MAVRLLGYVLADLCLGKPPLRSLSVSATVGDALTALKSSDDSCISVWSCDHSDETRRTNNCLCIGKICMVDIICYLSKEENLSSPSSALTSPLSVLMSPFPGLVRHVEPTSRYWNRITTLFSLSILSRVLAFSADSTDNHGLLLIIKYF